jgi:hypothetical protein
MARLLLALGLFLTMAASTFAQSSSPTTSPAAAENRKAASDAADQDELAALKADLQRLQTNLSQMRTNLGFVGNTTTPLYHEFELDIEMWQTMIAQMQRRVERLERQHGTAK